MVLCAPVIYQQSFTYLCQLCSSRYTAKRKEMKLSCGRGDGMGTSWNCFVLQYLYQPLILFICLNCVSCFDLLECPKTFAYPAWNHLICFPQAVSFAFGIFRKWGWGKNSKCLWKMPDKDYLMLIYRLDFTAWCFFATLLDSSALFWYNEKSAVAR